MGIQAWCRSVLVRALWWQRCALACVCERSTAGSRLGGTAPETAAKRQEYLMPEQERQRRERERNATGLARAS